MSYLNYGGGYDYLDLLEERAFSEGYEARMMDEYLEQREYGIFSSIGRKIQKKLDQRAIRKMGGMEAFEANLKNSDRLATELNNVRRATFEKGQNLLKSGAKETSEEYLNNLRAGKHLESVTQGSFNQKHLQKARDIQTRMKNEAKGNGYVSGSGAPGFMQKVKNIFYR